MVLWDSAIFSTALRLNAGLRGNLHSLRRLSENALTDNELDGSNRSSSGPAIISRFGDHQLRGMCELLISRAIAVGDIVGV